MIYYLLAAIIIVLDQSTKWAVIQNMRIGENISIIPGILYLTSLRNSGAAWSILQGQFIFFFIVTAIVMIVVIYYLQKYARKEPLLGVALGFVIGGTLGNFIDRLFRGQVVDFIHFYIVNYSYPVFNIADSALCIGVLLLLIYTIRDSRKKHRKEEKSNE